MKTFVFSIIAGEPGVVHVEIRKENGRKEDNFLIAAEHFEDFKKRVAGKNSLIIDKTK